MNFLSKKARLDLVAKTLIVTSILGTGSYIILNDTTVTAYATATSSNKELVKAKILNDLLAYKTDITFSTAEYTAYSIGTDSTADPKQVYFEVLNEHPEIFWTSQSVLGVTNTDGSGNKAYMLYVNNLYSDSDIATKKAELDSKIDSIISQFSSYGDLRKVYEIHDYVNANVTYDHTVAGSTAPTSSIDPNTDLSDYIADTRQITQNNASFFEAHSLYGAVMNGTAVCEGYAKLANVLLSKSGIEANIIVSNSHAWNYVKVNGNYYQLDTTWDDQSDNKTLCPYKYFNITNGEMLKDASSNVTLHNATSYIPNCTDTTFDNIFRTVGSNNIIQGKNVMRVNDKLYYLDDSTNIIYSYNLDGTNQSIIRNPESDDLLIYNLMAYNGDLYYLTYKTDATHTVLMQINKIDLSTNVDSPVLNINNEFGLANGSMPNISFYIDNNKLKVTCDGANRDFPLQSILAAGITISGGNSISVKGGTTQLTANVSPSNATDKTVTWTTSDNTIATVDSNGLVTAKADGAVVIKAKANDGSNVENTYNVTISGQSDIKATGITITGTNNISSKGGTTQLMATVAPSNTTDNTVIWSSSDNNIATVDSNGLVTAKTDGIVDIKATANDGSNVSSIKTITISGQAVVTPPTDVKVTGITISGGNNISTKGGTLPLTTGVSPSNATDKAVTWSSSDESVAIVNSNGLVTAKTDGSVDIKATANDGSGVSSTKTITISGQVVVTPPTDIKVTGISITGSSNITTKSGTAQLSATVTPSNATDKTITWSSSDDAIATVDSNGLVTAKANGNVVITATANDGSGIKSTKSITISGQTTTTTIIKVTGITTTGTDSISTKGGTLTLTAVVNPSDATNKTITWSSSDTSIATVGSSGVVTAINNGSVVIKATASDGSGVIGTKIITVTGQVTASTNVKVTGINITGNDNISSRGGNLTLTCNVSPSTATDKTVTWSSSDTSIATISSSGVVTAIANGTVTIIVTANDGSGIKGIKTITITITGQTTTTSSDSVLKSVSISGTEEVGHKLKTKIKYDGAEPDVKYKWQRASKKDGDYTDISGADEEEYKLKSGDKGKYIKVVATATINGTSYDVEDITSKISKDTSNDDEDEEDNDNSSSSSGNNSNNTVAFRPATSNGSSMGPVMPTGESPAGSGIITANSSSPANGQFTNPSGHPVSGWLNSNGRWYYLDNNGDAKTGWIQDNGKWYYLNTATDTNRGTMKTGWLQDTDGTWYYLYSDGSMATNTSVDGYKIGSNGAWIG
ncbi:hypothetical protein GKZ28_14435 [Clostridium chromiireducens]|uniref:BIG2 domain-containing protein n=1 Tax=Clostridium chromiireducens TaxID=225345 RepID=A0A964RNF7_9CLOT|nr:Ig-like domain-containing protein [Clostridium chromiireducens]MVX64892.1 hypothetical protein [Clostridium chromiireducens]